MHPYRVSADCEASGSDPETSPVMGDLGLALTGSFIGVLPILWTVFLHRDWGTEATIGMIILWVSAVVGLDVYRRREPSVVRTHEDQ